VSSRSGDFAASFGQCCAEASGTTSFKKRSLCAIDPLNSGKLSAEEVTEFEWHGRFAEAVGLRRVDDQSKDRTAQTPCFAHFGPIIEQVLCERPGI
jgi:predicted HD phosphohydrolase